MKKSLLFLAAFAGLTACVQDLKEDVVLNPVEDNGPALTINATMDEPQTRVVAEVGEDGLEFKFEEADGIGVYFYNQAIGILENVKFKAGAPDEDGKVVFEKDDEYVVHTFLNQRRTQLFAYAPYQSADGSIEGGITRSGDLGFTRKFTIPTLQENADDRLAVAKNYPVVAKPAFPVEDEDNGNYKVDMSFSGAASLIRFEMKNNTGESLVITDVRYTVAENEALTGVFTANLEADPKFPAEGEADNYALTPVADKACNHIDMELNITLKPTETLKLYGVINGGTYAPGSTMVVTAKPADTERQDYIGYTYTGTVNSEKNFPRRTCNGVGIELNEENCKVEIKEEDNIIHINEAEELRSLADTVNCGKNNFEGKTIILIKDIELNGIEIDPIGTKENPFKGTFDGNGKTIFNLESNGSAAGLFGYLSGTVKNLTLDKPIVKGTVGNVGAIAAHAADTTGAKILNCNVKDAYITASFNRIPGTETYNGATYAGAIIGYAGTGVEVIGCTVTGAEIIAYDAMGGIAGYAKSSGIVKDCTVDGVNLTVNAEDMYNYKGFTSSKDHKVNEIYGGGSAKKENNTVNNVTIKYLGYPVTGTVEGKEVYYKTLAGALEAGEAEIKLEAGEYELIQPKTKSLKITTEAEAKDVKLILTSSVSMNATDVTFENITIVSKNENHFGMQHGGNMTYNNCVIENMFTCYSDANAKSVFNDCEFKQPNKDYESIWTYGSNVDFKGCTFDCAGMAVLIYNEGSAGWKTVNLENCTFKAPETETGIAAIEIDSSLNPFIVNIDNCNVEGFDEGNMSGNNLYNLKSGTYGKNCYIYVNKTYVEVPYKDADYYFVPETSWASITTEVKYWAYCIDEKGDDVYATMEKVEDNLYKFTLPGRCEKVQFFITSATVTEGNVNVGQNLGQTVEIEIARTTNWPDRYSNNKYNNGTWEFYVPENN